MKIHRYTARGTSFASSMRLTPANYKHLQKQAAKMGVSINFYVNDLLKKDAEKNAKKKRR